MIELDQKENVGMVELRVLTVFEITVKMLWYTMCTLLTVKIDKEIFRLRLHNDPAFRMVVWRICSGFCCMCTLPIVKIDKIVF